VECEVWSVECEVWSVDCEVWSVECEVWSVECAVGSVQCEVWSVECGVWSVKCGVWSVKCEVELQLWHVKQDTAFAESTRARAWLAHGACKFYRWERSYIYILYIPKATSALPRAGTTGISYISIFLVVSHPIFGQTQLLYVGYIYIIYPVIILLYSIQISSQLWTFPMVENRWFYDSRSTLLPFDWVVPPISKWAPCRLSSWDSWRSQQSCYSPMSKSTIFESISL